MAAFFMLFFTLFRSFGDKMNRDYKSLINMFLNNLGNNEVTEENVAEAFSSTMQEAMIQEESAKKIVYEVVVDSANKALN